MAVRGAGFRFEAPSGWTVSHANGAVVAKLDAAGRTFVSATPFALSKTYDPKLFAQATKELDRVAAELARHAHGSLTGSETVLVAGRRIRSYRFTAHPTSGVAYAERIGFVLQGKREFQLLCRAPAGAADPAGACSLLYSTFSIGS